MSTQTIQLTQTPHRQARAEKKVSLTKIMVLTDFSEVSDLALQYGLALARRYDARIYFTHILSTDLYQLADPQLAEMTYKKMLESAEQGFRDTLTSGKLQGVPHETLLYEGALWPTVERAIQNHKIDLVVTGTHGRGEFKKLLLGSVAEAVFRQAACPVLTVGPQARKRAPHELDLQDILFATDFGPGSSRAAQYAFSLAQEHAAHLTVVHVTSEAESTAYDGVDAELLRNLHLARMKEFMPGQTENWCKVDFRVAFGEPAQEILNEARETGADLIVMGAKARDTFAGHRPLSVAYNVVAKAKCPVLTVRG